MKYTSKLNVAILWDLTLVSARMNIIEMENCILVS